MKSSVYRNISVTAFCLGLLALVVGCLEMSVSFESTNPDTSNTAPETSQLDGTSSIASSPQKAISANLATTTTSTKQLEHSNRENTHSALTHPHNSVDKTKAQGTLRMSNQTNQPVRLALLARQSLAKGSSSQQDKYDMPAHWDFAPQEGSEKGLILSLPQGNLNLDKGDILVAFAQDGSRRYWGPYVVGETSSPKWNAQNQEWQLVLSGE